MPDTVLPPAHDALASPGIIGAPRDTQTPSWWPLKCGPNFSDRQVGDLVLVHADGSLLAQALKLGQAFSLNPYISRGCHCTHAAIYVGNGMLVDATPTAGVVRRPVLDYCETRRLELRRIASPWIPSSHVDDIARCADAQVGKPYSSLKVVVDKLWPGQPPDPDRLYCSTLVGLMVAQATGVRLLWTDPQFRPFYPAVLATHPDLSKVTLRWCSV